MDTLNTMKYFSVNQIVPDTNYQSGGGGDGDRQ